MKSVFLRLFAIFVFSFVAHAQSPVFGLPNTGGSSVLWPAQSGSPVFGYPSGIQTVILTTFNEGTFFTQINGTSPAINAYGNLWEDWPGTLSLNFGPNGAISPGTSDGNTLNTGAPSYTVTFSGLTNTATNIVAFSMLDETADDRMELWMLGSGGIALKETVSGTTTQLQTQAVSAGATGSIVAVVHGTSISVTAFGQAPMLYTIPPGHGDIGGKFIAMLSVTFASVFGGVKVTVP